jgi:hypothetical protein
MKTGLTAPSRLPVHTFRRSHGDFPPWQTRQRIGSISAFFASQ